MSKDKRIWVIMLDVFSPRLKNIFNPILTAAYKKDPDNKNHLIIDYEVALVVREMFKRAADGFRPSEIADYLNQSNIMSPVMYRCSVHSNLDPDRYTKRQEWTSSTICKMLGNIVYLGHTAQGKTSKPSLKSKMSFRKPRDQWYIVENTHEPLITRDMFEIVRKRSVSRRNVPKTDFRNVFAGVAKCADCGGNMSITGRRKNGASYNLVCGRYKLYGNKECSNHFIDYQTLYQFILLQVREMIVLTQREKKQVLSAMEKTNRNEQLSHEGFGYAPLLKSLENKNKELDGMLRRLYEDNVNGKISDERYVKLNEAYEMEQKEIFEKIGILHRSHAQRKGDKQARDRSEEILGNITSIQELTPGLVKLLIDRIEIGQGSYEKTGKGKKKRQTVKIYWRFAGEIP